MSNEPWNAESAARISESNAKIQRLDDEMKALQKSGIDAQIASGKTLEFHSEQLKLMQQTISALKDHNIEKTKQQVIADRQRKKAETKRFFLDILIGVPGIISFLIMLWDRFLSK